MKHLIAAFTLFATPIAACPIITDAQAPEALVTELSGAEDYSTAEKAAHELWVHFRTAPDDQAQEWLDEGLANIRYSDYSKAEKVLAALVDYCPNYAEGYNQLAYAQFLQNDFDNSAINLQKTLELEPQHFAALAGMGLVEHGRGNLPLAKIWIRRALAIHPYMSERYILDIPDKTDDL